MCAERIVRIVLCYILKSTETVRLLYGSSHHQSQNHIAHIKLLWPIIVFYLVDRCKLAMMAVDGQRTRARSLARSFDDGLGHTQFAFIMRCVHHSTKQANRLKALTVLRPPPPTPSHPLPPSRCYWPSTHRCSVELTSRSPSFSHM